MRVAGCREITPKSNNSGRPFYFASGSHIRFCAHSKKDKKKGGNLSVPALSTIRQKVAISG
jgi:hypothetical protein